MPQQDEVGTLGGPFTFTGFPLSLSRILSIGRDQRVLILLCYPQDKDPADGGLTALEEKNRQIQVFEKLVNTAFRQMSFERTSFSFEYTDWIELPEQDNIYFWRQADIDAAQVVLDNLPPDATDEEREMAEANLEQARDNRNQIKKVNGQDPELYYDALKNAQNAGAMFDDYAGIMFCLATEHLRGYAHIYFNEVKIEENTDTVQLPSRPYLWTISHDSHWGRRIHELAHPMASPDLYNQTGFIADAAPWDMMGSHNGMPLFSGHNIVDKLGWYSTGATPTNVPANVKLYNWAAVPNLDESIVLRAHADAEDSQPNTSTLSKSISSPDYHTMLKFVRSQSLCLLL